MSAQSKPAIKVDYLIIGQGLAGSILAHQLISHRKKVLVIDNNHHQSASKVAAGIINPITGPRLTLSEDFHVFYPQAKSYYLTLERLFDTSLWQTLDQHRKLQNQIQQDYYRRRLEMNEYQLNLGNKTKSAYFDSDSECVEIHQSALVDTNKLINKLRNWLIEKEIYRHQNLDHNQIIITESGFTLEDIQARHAIFCEGFQAINNPWLSHLPFNLSKGEILTIDTDRPTTHLLNWGNWLTPFGDSAKLGSNYQWDDLTLTPDNNRKNELLGSLDKNTNIKGEVIKHQVGIRPTTRQRKPFIGSLSNLTGAYCFNGFGSKGCLLIPYYADLFCQHLLNKTPLNKDLAQWL